jgi:DNA-binding transcriptional regulator WhiA
MKYQGQFKIIDSKEKAYLLGLIMADGCLFYNKRSGAYQTKIKLKQSDKELLDKIYNIFPFFTEPRIEKRADKNHSYYIYCYCKELFQDLQLHGILERKSYENANNVFLPILNDDLFFSYLLGLFDGDGTIFQDNKGRIRMEVIGKNQKLFESIVLKLENLGIKSSLYYRKDKDYYMIRISQKPFVKLLIEEFQKYNLHLERKFKPYFNIDWSKIPGYDNIRKKYEVLFIKSK